MKTCAVVLMLFSMTGPVMATGCKFAARQAYVAPAAVSYAAPAVTYHAPAYQQQAVYKVATLLQLVPSSYYSHYVPAPVAPSEDEITATLKALRAELADVKARLSGAPPAPLPEPQRMPPPSNGGAFRNLTTACAACHDATVAKKKGGDLVLLRDGVRAELTGEQLGEIVDRVTTDDPARVMPPPAFGKLTPEAVTGVIREALKK